MQEKSVADWLIQKFLEREGQTRTKGNTPEIVKTFSHSHYIDGKCRAKRVNVNLPLETITGTH
jgi:hypothetical protein